MNPPPTPETPAPQLTGSDRRHLRSLSHGLDPVVRIGSGGVTEGVLSALDHALDDHELVKLRIAAERDERRAVAEELAKGTHSAVAGVVGQTALLYRPARDPEDRRITLPSAARRA